MNINYEWNTIDENQSDFIFDSTKIAFYEDYITLVDPADTSMPAILNVEGISFTLLTRFLISYVQPSPTSIIKFQISNDNYNWYFYRCSCYWYNSYYYCW